MPNVRYKSLPRTKPTTGALPLPDTRRKKIRIGDLVIDLAARSVSVDGKWVPLTEREYCILELLAPRRDITVTREMLLDHLYGSGHQPESRIIKVFVCQLRKKLTRATGGKHYIETVWGKGHRLRDLRHLRRLLDAVTVSDRRAAAAGSRSTSSKRPSRPAHRSGSGE